MCIIDSHFCDFPAALDSSDYLQSYPQNICHSDTRRCCVKISFEWLGIKWCFIATPLPAFHQPNLCNARIAKNLMTTHFIIIIHQSENLLRFSGTLTNYSIVLQWTSNLFITSGRPASNFCIFYGQTITAF